VDHYNQYTVLVTDKLVAYFPVITHQKRFDGHVIYSEQEMEDVSYAMLITR